MAQRQGRKGYMAGVDKIMKQKVELKESKRKKEEACCVKSKKDVEILNSKVPLLLSSNIETDENDAVSEEEPVASKRLKKQPLSFKPSKITLITKHVAAALDQTKVTATADALGHDIQELPLSYSSTCQARMRYREAFTTDLRSKFTPSSALVVHWDRKLLPDIIGKQKVDRLPVILSGVETEQLLGIPKITSGVGEAQAAAVVRCFDD